MYKQNNVFSQELEKYGFKGSHLRDLTNLITDEETMQMFYNFIILEGDGMTKSLLVHSFIEHMHEKRNYSDCETFISDYDGAETVDQKESVAKRLIGNISASKLNKVVKMFANNYSLLPNYYDQIARYKKRGIYTPDQIVTLLESLPIK